MEFSKVFTVKKEVTEEQFLRNVLIALSKDEKSPSNIFKSNFGKVTEFESEFLVLSANVVVNYSGSCGYDRKEVYYEQVKEYDYSIKNYRYKNVEKTRTVTDWRPHNGTLNARKAEVVLNKDNGDVEFELLFSNALKQVKNENVIEEGTADVNFSAYQSAIDGCNRRASWDVTWPGDRKKDYSYSFKTDVEDVQCYIVPCYMVEFVYNGKKYHAQGLAIGNVNEIHEVPQADGKVESIETIEKRRKSKVAEAEKPLKINKVLKVLAIIAFIVGIMGPCSNCFGGGIDANTSGNNILSLLTWIGLISTAILVVIMILIFRKVTGVVAEINSLADIEKKKLNNIKVDNLVEVLKKLNLPALSSVEKNSIKTVEKKNG